MCDPAEFAEGNRGGEIIVPFGDAEGGAVGREARLALGPRQDLGTVVGKGFGAGDVKIAALQDVSLVDRHAHFQRATIERYLFGAMLDHECLPALGCECEVNVAQHIVTAGVTMAAHDCQRVQ